MLNKNQSIAAIKNESSELKKRIDSVREPLLSVLAKNNWDNPENPFIIHDAPIGIHSEFFKVEERSIKIMSVRYANEIVSYKNWRMFFIDLMMRCVAIPKYRKALFELADTKLVKGSKRPRLSRSTNGIDEPLELCEELYFELRQDTENMLYFIVRILFINIGYDYSSIFITFKKLPLNVKNDSEEEIEPAADDDAPKLAVFWYVDGKFIGEYRDVTSGSAILRGEYLQLNFTHNDIWKVCNPSTKYECDRFLRGRILFDTKHNIYRVVASSEIVNDAELCDKIRRVYCLPSSTLFEASILYAPNGGVR